jgi:hypothetical protein
MQLALSVFICTLHKLLLGWSIGDDKLYHAQNIWETGTILTEEISLDIYSMRATFYNPLFDHPKNNS